MPVRRTASPDDVRMIWDSIKNVSHQRQRTDLIRLAKYAKKMFDIETDETERMLNLCLQDNLIKQVYNSANRGFTKGVELKSYRLPIEFLKTEDLHDWYCFECHIGGDVTCCNGCTRVFHPACSKSASITSNTNNNPRQRNDDLLSVPESILSEDQASSSVANDSIEIVTNDNENNVVQSEALTTNRADNNNKDGSSKNNLNGNTNVEQVAKSNISTGGVNSGKDNGVIDLTQANILRMKNILSAKLKEHLEKKPNVKSETFNDNESSNIKEEGEPSDTKVNILSPTKTELEDCIITHSNLENRSEIALNESSILKMEEDNNEDTGLDPDEYCSVCRMLQHEEKYEKLVGVTIEEINHLLGFTYERIKNWLPEDSMSPLNSPPSTSTQPGDLQWRISYMVKRNILKSAIKSKMNNVEYTSFGQFYADVLDLQHAVAVVHGTSSSEFQAAGYMIEDCKYDLDEVNQCRDCYRHSNEKSVPYWFAKPCMPRHELVFAKQIGYSYWPAKVIKLTKDGLYDVRFFGHQHLRAVIDLNNVKPIDTDLASLKIQKRTGSFKKALDELYRHQQLLTYPPGAFSYQVERSQNIDDIAMNNSVIENIMPSEFNTPQSRRATRKDKSREITSKSKNIKKRIITNRRNSQIFRLGRNINNIADESHNNINNFVQTTNDISVYNFTEDNEMEIDVPVNLITNKTPNTRQNRLLNSSKNERTAAQNANRKLLLKKAAQRKAKNKKDNNRKKSNNLAVLSRHSTPSNSIDELESTTSPPRISKNQENSKYSQERLISSTQRISSPHNEAMSPVSVDHSTASSPRPREETINEMRALMNETTDIEKIKQLAIDTLHKETERWQYKLHNMVDDHNVMISEIKKKQWCYYCEQEAIYHCCWNTAYCSTICQQNHWQSEHKRTCRRKR